MGIAVKSVFEDLAYINENDDPETDVVFSITESVPAVLDIISEIEQLEAGELAYEAVVDVKVDIITTIVSKIKQFLWRIWEAIRNFFENVFHFFQSKIMRTEQKILKDNFHKIETYYRESESVKIDMYTYLVTDPGKEYLDDSKTFERAVPEICAHIDNIIREIENPSGFINSVKYTTGFNRDDSGIKKLKKELFGKLAGSKADPNILTENNISTVIRHKYFGEQREISEQEIKQVFTDISVYKSIISEDAYKAFKNLYTNSRKTINDSIKAINSFELFISKASGNQLKYMAVDSRLKDHRNLLVTL